MRLIKVDSFDQVSHSGHHLERKIPPYEFDKFHVKQRTLLAAFSNLQAWALPGFEIVAVFQTHVLTADGSFHFGGSELSESKAGMHVLHNNHMGLWLRDQERRPVISLVEIFYEELNRIFHTADTEEPDKALRALIADRITHTIRKLQDTNRSEVVAAIAQLTKLHEYGGFLINLSREVSVG